MKVRIDTMAYVPTWDQRARERDATLASTREIQRAFPNYRRERPRNGDEAELLRRIGTPDRLIGPARVDSTDSN